MATRIDGWTRRATTIMHPSPSRVIRLAYWRAMKAIRGTAKSTIFVYVRRIVMFIIVIIGVARATSDRLVFSLMYASS